MLDQSNQPTHFRHLSLPDSLYQKWGYQLKEISVSSQILWKFYTVKSCVFSFHDTNNRDLVCWWDLCKKLSFPLYYSSILCVLHHYFLLLNFLMDLSWCQVFIYSCCYMTLVVQWLKLALSNGCNRVDVSFPSSEDGNKSCFQNVAFASI
jgi:hypothetical protein